MLACRILRLGSRDGFTSLLHLLRTRLKRRGGRRAEPVPLRPRLAGDAGELRVELSRGRRTQRGECGGLPDRRDGSGPCDALRGTAAVFIAGAGGARNGIRNGFRAAARPAPPAWNRGSACILSGRGAGYGGRLRPRRARARGDWGLLYGSRRRYLSRRCDRSAIAAGGGRHLAVRLDRAGVACLVCSGIAALAALLPLIDGGFIMLFLSFVLFCSTFLVVVVSTTYIVRLARKPEA